MTPTERIAGAAALLARYQGTPWEPAALAYMRAQIEQVRATPTLDPDYTESESQGAL